MELKFEDDNELKFADDGLKFADDNELKTEAEKDTDFDEFDGTFGNSSAAPQTIEPEPFGQPEDWSDIGAAPYVIKKAQITMKEYYTFPRWTKSRVYVPVYSIILYIQAIASLAVSSALGNTFSGFIDFITIAGLTTGVALKKSRVCAVLLAFIIISSQILNLVLYAKIPSLYGGLLCSFISCYFVKFTFDFQSGYKDYQMRNLE